MSTRAVQQVTRVTGISPQFLVDDLERAIAYYCDKLGFKLDFKYEDFYAAVSRDGFAIHLKCAPKSPADREYRKKNEHLDAYISVVDIRELYRELESRGAQVARPLEQRPWGCLDFYVEDVDGNIVCFSEPVESGGQDIGSSGHLIIGPSGDRVSGPSIGGSSGEQDEMTQQLRTTFGRPTPELPVEDVERAQRHYRDVLGFEIGWLYPGGGIGAVSRDEAVIFFRKRERPFEPAVHWVFAAEIDATYQELRGRGARIVEPLEKKPWGLRQFTVEDIDGNRFYFHCD